MNIRTAVVLGWLATPALIGGCAALGGGGSSAQIASVEHGATLAPVWKTAIYASPDDNTADVILSDLDLDQLLAVAEGREPHAGVEASILRVRMFLHPRAGRTPIDDTASNAAATLLVLARGEWGVYGGGGFMLPSDRSGAKSISGTVRDATLRLTGATTGFDDLLGASDLSGRITATRNDAPAARIAAWVGTIAGDSVAEAP